MDAVAGALVPCGVLLGALGTVGEVPNEARGGTRLRARLRAKDRLVLGVYRVCVHIRSALFVSIAYLRSLPFSLFPS